MNNPQPLLLVTGATGKVGQHFLARFFADQRFENWRVRVLCHERLLESAPRLEVRRGNIAEQSVVQELCQDVTHVLHLATCKETPDQFIDVSIKGLFWILEECRTSEVFQQLILLGGDAAMGHFFYPHPIPVAETQPHSAYPGCYALSKVLEETMLEQYAIAHDLNVCCLRAPWIMEKDDFKFQLSFGQDVFGGPRWCDLVGEEAAQKYIAQGAVPLMLDPEGTPVMRNFVHVSDLAGAIACALDHPAAGDGETFNVCMDEPIDYGRMAAYLAQTRNMPAVEVPTPYYSTWLDNSKAKFLLGWRPQYDMPRLIDEAFDYERAADDLRKIWYPG